MLSFGASRYCMRRGIPLTHLRSTEPSLSERSSRTTRSARNAGVSILTQLIVVVLGFATRTVFVAELGVALLGVNTVLMSIVALLAFADLGINGALMYALYGPLKRGDRKTTAAIVRYAGQLFRWVALAVAVLGIALLPFLHLLVRLDEGIAHLEAYYLVLLVNTVAGYLMLSRLVLLNADQKIYLTKTYSLVFNVIRSVGQIASLLIYGDFFLFLVIQVVFTVLNNAVVYRRAGLIYPYLKRSSETLSAGERRSVLESVKALAIYRIGGLVLSNATPLLVSLIAGTVALGYYSNYMLILGAAILIVEAAFAAITPSIGNLVASGDQRVRRAVFDEMTLLAILVHGIISVAFVVLASDFVALWLGPTLVLPEAVVVAMALNFYVAGTLMALWVFRSATGLFRQTQFMMVFTALLSIALSFLLGPWLGITGVLLAPTVARLATGAWYEPRLLIRDHLTGRFMSYVLVQVLSLLLWASLTSLIILLGLVVGGVFASIYVQLLLVVVVTPLAGWAAFGRTVAFKSLVARVSVLFRAFKRSRA